MITYRLLQLGEDVNSDINWPHKKYSLFSDAPWHKHQPENEGIFSLNEGDKKLI